MIEEQELLDRRVSILEEDVVSSLELLREIKNDLILFNAQLDNVEEKLLDISPLPW